MNINSSHLPDLHAIYRRALSAVEGQQCVHEFLRYHPISGEIYLLAIGKAACSMAKGAQKLLASQIMDALLVTRHGYVESGLSGFSIVEAGHPLPDQSSLDAGRQVIAFVERIPETATLLCLISGGASSLVEVLPEATTLVDLKQLNQWLLQSGLPIAKMNMIRKQVSCIKGGRLAQYLKTCQVLVLLMSDVQGDDPAVIGSGLFFPSPAQLQPADIEKLPASIRQIFSRSSPMPAANNPCFKSIRWQIIANVSQALRAADEAAKQQGLETDVHQTYLQGDAIECGKYIAQVLQEKPNVLHLWGGETTVTLPVNPGTGGRCHSLALSTAIAMQHRDNWCLLAAGTDGSDGTADAAGVYINAGSLAKAESKLSGKAQQYLDSADAGAFFAASEDQLKTGVSGTNVNDLVFGYCAR